MTVVDGGFQHTVQVSHHPCHAGTSDFEVGTQVQVVCGHKSRIERLERQVPHVVLLPEKVLQVVQCHAILFVGRQFTAYAYLLIKIVVALLVKGD